MPEGPEIRRAADHLSAALTGRQARLVEFAFPALHAAAARLSGQTVTRVEPRGKAMLTHFSGGETIYSHNQLYGEWRLLGIGESPQASLQVRLAIHTDESVAVLYSASEIEVWNTADLQRHPYLRRLGVELLSPETRVAHVAQQVNDQRWARKGVAGALLDQGFLAGVGNYLRSEILFAARIEPNARIGELTPAGRQALARAALNLTRQSYRTGGITNDVAIAKRMQAAGAAFGRYRHWVFDRAGEPCHRCGTLIRRDDVGGRGLYWCMRCQAKK